MEKKFMEEKIWKIGFIVNPIAGMGGIVGLKGTDGEEILKKAIELGAQPVAPQRAKIVLKTLLQLKKQLKLITYPYEMGENEAISVSFSPLVIGNITPGKTTAEDTKQAAKEMKKLKVDLIVFCGGDGTACDIYEAIGDSIPVIGVPTGVKMHSAVFAVNPKAAAEVAIKFLTEGLPLRRAEVMDIDEEAFRAGILSAKLKGYLLVPYEPELIQGVKTSSPLTDDEEENKVAIARYIVENMDPDAFYILGPGTTTKAIADLLGVEKTLLGVDIIKNGKIVARDVGEREILKTIDKQKSKIIITPIGNQGFIFGRGNQQISPRVIRKVGIKNIIVIATKYKLSTVKYLRVDTGDEHLDKELKGYIRVVTDYNEEKIVRVV
ncbi:MAG: ATP-NAD kinase family protein [Candidatus Baldrarchaeota archaeon]